MQQVDKDHSEVNFTSKTGNFFIYMKAATTAPEASTLPANRIVEEKRHLGFRCCWSEWITVFSQGYEAEVTFLNSWETQVKEKHSGRENPILQEYLW